MPEDCPARFPGDGAETATSHHHRLDERTPWGHAEQRAAESLDNGEKSWVSHIVTHYSVLPPPWVDALRRASICCWINLARGERVPSRAFSGEAEGGKPSVPC